MRPHDSIFCALAVFLFLLSGYAVPSTSADTDVWECPLPDGTSLYTNKERSGCHAMELRPLSLVPAFDASFSSDAHLRPHESAAYFDGFSYDTPAGALRNATSVPDWGREWQASNSLSGSVQGEVCTMYGEWLRLNEKSRGGIFFGTDPSYGSDPTARSFRTPSYSFYDNTRWITLARMFGAGFVPIGCP